jgi:sporulation protein YlmC with PRC-barrel domain
MKKNIITTDDILGKEVVDAQGEVLGVIQMLHIDKSTKSIVGITVDQGFMKPDLFIGLEYIQQFGVDTVFLNTFPRDKIKGMQVLNANGKNVGVVSSINFSDSNRLKSIVVKKGFNSSNEIISVSRIREIGYNVILKDDEIKQY